VLLGMHEATGPFRSSVSRHPTISIFLYEAQAVGHMLAVAFGNKLCWFESRHQHISLCIPGSWTRASSSLQKQTVGSSPTINIFLYVSIRLRTFTEGNCWACECDGCAWHPGWFCSRVVSGVGCGREI